MKTKLLLPILILLILSNVSTQSLADQSDLGVNTGDVFTFILDVFKSKVYITNASETADDDIRSVLLLNNEVSVNPGDEFTLTILNSTIFYPIWDQQKKFPSIPIEWNNSGNTTKAEIVLNQGQYIKLTDWENQKSELEQQKIIHESRIEADGNSTGSFRILDSSDEFGYAVSLKNITTVKDGEILTKINSNIASDIRYEKSTGVLLYSMHNMMFEVEKKSGDSVKIAGFLYNVEIHRKGYNISEDKLLPSHIYFSLISLAVLGLLRRKTKSPKH